MNYPTPISRTLVIRLTHGPGHKAAACLAISGDVCMAGDAHLAAAARHVAAARFARMHIDLGGITFGGSTLANFLVRISLKLPTGTPMTLCRPGTMTRQLIELTGLDRIATVSADLPDDWNQPSPKVPGSIRTTVPA